MAICSCCCGEIEDDEVQKCETCLMDGLGNCCIGKLDHTCKHEEDEEGEENEEQEE